MFDWRDCYGLHLTRSPSHAKSGLKEGSIIHQSVPLTESRVFGLQDLSFLAVWHIRGPDVTLTRLGAGCCDCCRLPPTSRFR